MPDCEYMTDKFYKKSDKAHRVAYSHYTNGDYIACLNVWLEEKYFKALAPTLYGDEGEDCQPKKAPDLLRTYLQIGNDGSCQAFRALKKMGKLDKKPLLEEAVSQFILGVADDFVSLSQKSLEVYQTLENMESMEAIKRGLTHHVDTPCPEDRLFKEDAEAMKILNRRKSANALNPLKKEFQRLLQ